MQNDSKHILTVDCLYSIIIIYGGYYNADGADCLWSHEHENYKQKQTSKSEVLVTLHVHKKAIGCNSSINSFKIF
jgi:hypothetical protein